MSMLSRLKPQDRRAVMLGMLVSLPVLAHAFAVKPYRAAIADTRAQIEQDRALLERELTLLAQAPRMPAEIRQARQTSRAASQRLFGGADAIEATSAMSSYVGRALRDANLVVQQVETRDAAAAPAGLREIALDVRAEGSLAGVLRGLRSLESGARLVRVTRIGVERSLASPAPGAAEAVVLSATVRGYAIVDGSARAEQ